MLELLVTIEEGAADQMILSFACKDVQLGLPSEVEAVHKAIDALMKCLCSENSITVVGNETSLEIAEAMANRARAGRILPPNKDDDGE